MNCETVEDFLSGAQLHDLQLSPENLLLHHAKHCSSCQQRLVDTQRYLQTIASLEQPELGLAGAQRVLGRLGAKIEQKSQAERQSFLPWWRRGFGLGFVTASILCAAVVLFLPRNETAQKLIPVAQIDRGVHEQNIALVIDVPLDMSQANLILEFPANLRWSGLEDMERIEWPVNLQKGENILELPVSYALGNIPQKPQVITASIRYGETSRSFALPVSLSTQLSGREKHTEFSL
jgi:hypothetical protein